jgi:hypothetical protein
MPAILIYEFPICSCVPSNGLSSPSCVAQNRTVHVAVAIIAHFTDGVAWFITSFRKMNRFSEIMNTKLALFPSSQEKRDMVQYFPQRTHSSVVRASRS